MVYIFTYKKSEVDFNTAMSAATMSNCGIERTIDYDSADISISRTLYKFNKLYISGIINGVKYEEADVDELVHKGIINATYYIVDFKYLTAEEYINHAYSDDFEVLISHNGDITINDDFTVYGKIPKRVDIPTTFENIKNPNLNKNMLY